MNGASLGTIAAAAALLLLVAVLALWRVSVRMRDVSIIDIGYAPLVASSAVLGFAIGHRGLLQWLLLGAYLAWAACLGRHLFRRNIGHGEDPRYAKLRGWVADERAFVWFSLRRVFLHQGVVFWVLGLPAMLVMAALADTTIGPLALAGLGVWATGLALETIADRQLARFRADPARRGQVLDSGLWRFSRHPNYFGEACVHAGFALMACTVPWGLAAFAAPLLLTHYLVNVTGVRTLEKKLLREKPGYAEYVARTSAFVPMPPRG
jgi:steroid 5-alpha reductase family enzyme